MKGALISIAIIFLIALLAIGIWFNQTTRGIEARTQAFVDVSQARTPIQVTFAVTPPPGTPADQTLYLSGSSPALGNWDAAGVPLQPNGDGRHYATAQVLSGIAYGFKITRGTWGTVEKDAQGNEIPDRTLRSENDATLDIVVERWVDEGKTIPGRITLAGLVREHPKFHSDLLDNERKLVVYLPPGYDNQADRRYPVLYMNDGQNLFNEAESYAGVEWRVDETAQRLIAAGAVEPVIIVGVYNTPDRTAEFTPGQKADAYADMLATEIKPFIDRIYRTRPEADHTAVAGSSLGGLAALHTAGRHPDVFHQAAALSPLLSVDGRRIALPDPDAVRLYLDMGTAGGTDYDVAQQLADARALTGDADGQRLSFLEIDGGRHTEADYADRFGEVLAYLFPADRPSNN